MEHPRLHRTEVFGRDSFGHQFRLGRPEEVDEVLEALIREGYATGEQRQLVLRDS